MVKPSLSSAIKQQHSSAKPMFMIRAIFFGVMAVASAACAFAAELPELDILELCKDAGRKDILRLRLPEETFRKSAYSFCLSREVDAKRDAKWRLRMLSEENQQTCIDQGVTADTYTAVGDCLDQFTGPLRGSVD